MKLVLEMPSVNPFSLAISSAFSCVTPTKETSGCVKHAAGTELWLRMLGRPSMFSMAEMPWGGEVGGGGGGGLGIIFM